MRTLDHRGAVNLETLASYKIEVLDVRRVCRTRDVQSDRLVTEASKSDDRQYPTTDAIYQVDHADRPEAP